MSIHEQIQDWIAVYRDLDEETRRRVDSHVETCDECAHALAEVERVDRALAGLAQPAPDASLRNTFYREIGWADKETAEERRLRHFPTILSAAAAVVAVILLIGVLRALLNDAPNQSAQLQTSTTPTVVGLDADGITLASYRLNTAGIIPGEPLQVTLNWESTVDEETERTMFVRLYNDAETLIVQSERRLTFSPQAPNVTDFHEVIVPANVEKAAAPYHLAAAIGDTASETEVTLTELSVITPDDDFVVAGSIEDFPLGSVTHLSLDATFTDPWPRSVGIRQPAVVSGTSGVSVSPIPIWLVRDEQGDVRALYNRDPSSGCQINYQEQDKRFIDPCYGADYSRQGELLENTSPRGLDRFPVNVRDGQVLVDISHLIFGSPAPHPPTPPAIDTQETYVNSELGYAIDYPPDWRVRESSNSSNIVTLSSYPPEDAPQRDDDFSPNQAKIEIVPMMSRAGIPPSLETMVSRVKNDTEVEVLWKEEWELAGGIPAVRMQITGTLTGENALLLTVINYTSLHIQGYGDLFPFDDVARTLRPLETDSAPTATPIVDTTNVSSTNTSPTQTPTPEVAIVATPVWSTRVGIQGAIVRLNQAGCNDDLDAYRDLLDPDAPANWREDRVEIFRSTPTCPEDRTDIERISVNDNWAMAAVRIDNGAYVLRYFRRDDDGLWKLTAPVAEPWGELRTLRTDLVEVRYHAFDEPYVQEVAPSLDAFVAQVTDDLGITLDADQPIVMHVVPADQGRLDLLSGTPPPIAISPLSVPGLVDGVTATTPADALQRVLFEILTGHLIRSTFPERHEEEWPRFIDGVIYWEMLHARETYSREQALDSVADASTRQPISHLLDPQYTEPSRSIQQFFALFTFITETYGRNSLGPLVEVGFQADDWETVVTQALDESPDEFSRRWNEWIEANRKR